MWFLTQGTRDCKLATHKSHVTSCCALPRDLHRMNLHCQCQMPSTTTARTTRAEHANACEACNVSVPVDSAWQLQESSAQSRFSEAKKTKSTKNQEDCLPQRDTWALSTCDDSKRCLRALKQEVQSRWLYGSSIAQAWCSTRASKTWPDAVFQDFMNGGTCEPIHVRQFNTVTCTIPGKSSRLNNAPCMIR